MNGPAPGQVRLRLDLAYDGAGFHGWASQPGLRTVQETVELALGRVLRLSDVALTVAGRTDAGVHARGQVAHVDVEAAPYAGVRGRSGLSPAAALRRRLDAVLPDDVRVRAVTEAPPGFDARFSASWRRYAYRICDRPAYADPLMRGHVLQWRRPLDEAAMNRAADLLLGEHDFASFCKRREGATTVRSLHELEWTRCGGQLEARVVADAFCHHMVRCLVGCLVVIGEGRQPPAWAGEVLTAARRDPRVTVVPAHGLTLEEVGYPADAELAAQAERARVVRRPPGSP